MQDACDRWELLTLVQELRKELGLSDRDIMVLRAHLSVLPAGPLLIGEINLSFMKVKDILGRACGMDERRFREGEFNLHNSGLVRRKLSSNFRRYPERDGTGRIIGGYGIDLNPLLERRTELLALRERLASERRIFRQKRNSLSARFQEVLRLLWGNKVDLPSAVIELKQRMRNVMRRKSTTLADLEELELEINEIDKAPSPTATVCHSAVDPHSAVSDGVLNSASSRQKPSKSEGGDGGFIRHIESKSNKEILDREIRFDPVRLQSAWLSTQTLKAFYPSPPGREREAAGLLFEFASYLGLGQKVLIDALTTFGWESLIHVVDYLAERVDQLKYPDGYLSAMIKSFDSGQSIAGGAVHPTRLPRNLASV